MKITEHIKNASDTLFSFEILPPLKGQDISQIYRGIDPLLEFNPPFIDVTYHREEWEMKLQRDGTYRRITTRKRPGTVAICAAIMNRYKVDAVPHLICGGFSREETENALIDLNFLGIDNVLVLRGDNLKHENSFKPEPDGNRNALELVEQVQSMNHGRYIDEDLVDPHPTSFCVGVAGYPEKHHDAPNLKSDHLEGQAGVHPPAAKAMTILYRYLTSQMMAATAGAVAVLSLIIVLGNAFKQIFELLVNDEMPLSLIFKMVGLLVPQALTFTMPWGILVAALIVFGRMSPGSGCSRRLWFRR